MGEYTKKALGNQISKSFGISLQADARAVRPYSVGDYLEDSAIQAARPALKLSAARRVSIGRCMR